MGIPENTQGSPDSHFVHEDSIAYTVIQLLGSTSG